MLYYFIILFIGGIITIPFGTDESVEDSNKFKSVGESIEAIELPKFKSVGESIEAIELPNQLQSLYDEGSGFNVYKFQWSNWGKTMEEKEKSTLELNSPHFAKQLMDYFDNKENEHKESLIIRLTEDCLNKYEEGSRNSVYIVFSKENISEIKRFQSEYFLMEESWWKSYLEEYMKAKCVDGYIIGDIAINGNTDFTESNMPISYADMAKGESVNSIKYDSKYYHNNNYHIGRWHFNGEKGTVKMIIQNDGTYFGESTNDLYGNTTSYGNWYLDYSSVTNGIEGSWLEFYPNGRYYPIQIGQIIKDGNVLLMVNKVGSEGRGEFIRY